MGSGFTMGKQGRRVASCQGVASRLTVVSASVVGILLTASLATTDVSAQVASNPSDARPYDDKLLRLSDILGSVHFLRELCGHSDGQLWREKMRELTDAEGSSALRRAKLARGFNNGYRNYSRSYTTCTPSAETATTRLITEGAEIAETLVRNIP
jgi:uncharacterized protein (TIGR02301 family)